MRQSKRETFRFTHIYLENWRNFAKVDLDLQNRAFLVGLNASGKSNFWMPSDSFMTSCPLVENFRKLCASRAGFLACAV